MTNQQIIAEIAKEIYGEEAVEKLQEEGKEIPLHTLKGWALRGPYRIKQGEHGIETRLWQRRKGKQDNEESTDDDEGQADFVLVKSYLFREDQIEKVKS